MSGATHDAGSSRVNNARPADDVSDDPANRDAAQGSQPCEGGKDAGQGVSATDAQPTKAYPTAFTEGNEMGVTHGAYSTRRIEAMAEAVREEITNIAPWIDRPEYASAVSRWLRVEARSRLLSNYVEQVAADRGVARVPRRLWADANSTDRLASQLASSLGLDPIGRARIAQAASGAAVNQSTLAELAEQGREARLAAGQENDI